MAARGGPEGPAANTLVNLPGGRCVYSSCCRPERSGFPRRTATMRDDLRYALRQLRHQPAFALLAVATLAIGIGAAAAMFGLIQGVLLSPPPYADPDRLVLIAPARVDGQPLDRGATVGHVQAWRGARSLQRPALYRWTF